METIFSWLRSQGYPIEDRDEDHTAMFVLESDKMSKAQLAKATGGRYLTQEKLDGVFSFVAVVYRNGEYRAAHFGRSGKLQMGCEHLNERACAELARVSEYGGSRCGIYISEVTSDAPLAVLSGYMNPNRIEEVDAPAGMVDNFHDWLHIADFKAGISHKEAADRYQYLLRLLRGTSLNLIGSQEMWFGDGVAMGKSFIQKKKEGAVLKLACGTWEAGKRDHRQVKVKEKLSYDVTVIGICSGKEGSKYEHTLGKLLVLFRAFGNPRAGEWMVVPISGMTDAQRALWWNNPELIIGKCVKMDAKSFTEFGNLREPRFKEVREDKESDFGCLVHGFLKEYTKGKCVWKEWQYHVCG